MRAQIERKQMDSVAKTITDNKKIMWQSRQYQFTVLRKMKMHVNSLEQVSPNSGN